MHGLLTLCYTMSAERERERGREGGREGGRERGREMEIVFNNVAKFRK